jgi:cobalt-zinc-cadmium efflux system outer membrane protein
VRGSLVVIIFGSLLAVPSWAETGTPLPPDDAALAAIDERPAVREALALQLAAGSQAEALRVGPHEFTLGGAYGQKNVDGEGDYNEWEASITRSLRWPGKARIDRDLGGVLNEAAENSLADARHAEARALLAGWFGWLKAEAQANTDRELARALQQAAGAVRNQLKQGDASQMHLELAEAEAGRAAAAAGRSTIAARQSRHALQIAYPALSVPEQPPEVVEPVAPERPLAEWPAVILERSHELRLAELAESQAQLRAQRATKDRWPDPTVGVRMLDEFDGAEKTLGVVVSVPLPGRYRSALAAQGRDEAAAAAARTEAARREIVAIAAQDVAQAQAALAAWRPMQAAAEQAARYLQRAQRAYELGETGLAELLMSVSSCTETLYEERAARLEAHEALARLRVDAHELWAPAHEDHDH